MSGTPPYPRHWEFDTVLGEGGTAHVRPILPTDAEALVRFHDRLSRETRYYRFFSPKSELTPTEVERFTTVDHVDRVALIALVGDDIVAVARYDRLPDPDDEGQLGGDAEVAFTIDDAHQGHGLGTLMLEYLAAAGREHGIRRFVAETMPDNRRMIAVFHAAGYRTTNRFADGMVQVEFPIAATADARDAVRRREHDAEAHSIARLLAPGSVVLIGSLAEPDAPARVVLDNLRAGGFAGPIHTVERAVDLVGLDERVDLAIVSGPAGEAIEAVAACAGHGVTAVVVVGEGFAGSGPEVSAADAALLGAARHEGLRLVGPCSVGVANTAIGLDATLAPVVPRAGRVGAMVDSGPVALELLARMAACDLGLSTFVSAGHKADVSGNDLLQYWEDDPATDVALLHLESFGNPRKFARVARRVGGSIPIVAVWPGGVPGHDLDDRAVDALFHQAGVVRVGSIDEMVEVAARLVAASERDDASEPDAMLGREGEWRRRVRGAAPVFDDVDDDAAVAVVESALADADQITAPPTAVRSLLSAYGIRFADALETDTTPVPVTVAIVQDPTFGSLVTVGSRPGAGFAPSDLRLVPLTDRDADELAAGLVPGPSPAFADLLLRLGLLADDLEEVEELVLDPVLVDRGGVAVGAVTLRLRRVAPHLPDLVRRLRT